MCINLPSSTCGMLCSLYVYRIHVLGYMFTQIHAHVQLTANFIHDGTCALVTWGSLKAVILSMYFPVVCMRGRQELKGKVHQLEDELASAQKQSEDEVVSSKTTKLLSTHSPLVYRTRTSD